MRLVRLARPDKLANWLRRGLNVVSAGVPAGPAGFHGPLSPRAFMLRLCFLGLISTIYVSNFGLPTVKIPSEIDREPSHSQR